MALAGDEGARVELSVEDLRTSDEEPVLRDVFGRVAFGELMEGDRGDAQRDEGVEWGERRREGRRSNWYQARAQR